jgi:hypothetical protein
MLVKTLLISSLRKIGVVASGETPDNEELQDSLEAFQVMLRSLASKRLIVYASTKESFTLVSGQASYSWGTGGNITTARPNQVINAFIRDTQNTDHPVDVISEGQYQRYTNKGTSGRPTTCFYHPLYPLGYLYTYPTPQDAETMWLDSMKPFTETSSFDSLYSTLAFPLNYEEPLIYMLAVRVAPEYGKTVSAEVAAMASSGYDSLITFNSGNQVEPLVLNLPISRSGTTYDIESG